MPWDGTNPLRFVLYELQDLLGQLEQLLVGKVPIILHVLNANIVQKNFVKCLFTYIIIYACRCYLR